jgi:hypothetical protein
MTLRERLARRLAPTVFESRDILMDILRKKYDYAWQDHLARCDCHDSWDQCPCLSIGHDWNPGQMVANCANRCCRWCSPGESRTINEVSG